MTENKRFEFEALNHQEYVIAELDSDNYYLDDENSAKALVHRLNELYNENEQLKNDLNALQKKYEALKHDFEALL